MGRYGLIFILCLFLVQAVSGYTLSDDNFTVVTGTYGEISSLKIKGDAFPTEYVFNATNNSGMTSNFLGELLFKYRLGTATQWITATTNQSADARTQSQSGTTVTVTYENSSNAQGIKNFKLVESYSLADGCLRWQITVTNTASQRIEFGDFGLPLPFNQRFPDNEVIYETRVLQPGFIGLNSSFVHPQRPSGVGPFLLMLPDAATGAGFEYQDFPGGPRVYYIHSNVIKSTGRGYLPNTSLVLDAGQTKVYAFKFFKVQDRFAMADRIYAEGLIDITVVPGMVVATNLTVKFDLHTKKNIDSVKAQYPTETTISPGGTVPTDHKIYQATFKHLGPNNVTVYYGGNEKTVLQFYVTEPFGDATQRHATFMVDKQLVRAPGRHYHMVIDDWLMDTKAVRGKYQDYWGWGDDWGYTHAQFLALKNVLNPVAREVTALDGYLDTCIWLSLMDGHHEDYLIHDFLEAPPNNEPTYRGYAYPHIYNTYFDMYNIARLHPDIVKFINPKNTYLLRAYNILKAMYSRGVYYNWDTGEMGEQTTPDIIEALKREGYTTEANWIVSTMLTKYNNFQRNKYPYGSEFKFDNTGEEAAYMLAKMHGNTDMMKTVVTKTIGCRGLAPEWYHYSDPGTQSGTWNQRYATALTGYLLNDWLLNHSTTPEKELPLTYAAKTANFSNINSGQIDSDPANIGATAWCYQRQKGTRYSYCDGGNLHNGWWQMSGESDLALFGVLRLVSSDVANDPVFGLIGYGCEATDEGTRVSVAPLDGFNKRLNMVSLKMSLVLEQDQYSLAVIDKSKTRVHFVLRNMKTSAHRTTVSITGLNAGSYDVRVDGVVKATVTASAAAVLNVLVDVGTAASYDIDILPEGTPVQMNGLLVKTAHSIGITPMKNGIQFNYLPGSSGVTPPSLKIFSLQGKQLGFLESIPAGLSTWKQTAGTTPSGICFVRVIWPDGKSETRSVVLAR
ncbi:MAG: hypothetical protein JXA71_02805 [Chitinispirillaceae bacterium]|nr:hypothetical protein [Chitinispirillaceae bacterium]